MSTGSSHLHSQTGQTEWALQVHTTFFKYPSIQATSSLGRAFLPQLLSQLPILSGDVPQTQKGVTAESQHLNGKEQIRKAQTGFGYSLGGWDVISDHGTQGSLRKDHKSLLELKCLLLKTSSKQAEVPYPEDLSEIGISRF